MGLACLGDLVLTCTDDQSRNRRFGMALGSGRSLSDATNGIDQVVEGVPAARAVQEVAAQCGVDMPICGRGLSDSARGQSGRRGRAGAHGPGDPRGERLKIERKLLLGKALFFTVLLSLATLVNTFSVLADRARDGNPLALWRPLVWESSSNLLVLLLVPALAWWLARFPLTQATWWRSLPAHLLGDRDVLARAYAGHGAAAPDLPMQSPASATTLGRFGTTGSMNTARIF